MMNILFVGLGRMGFHMAGHIAEKTNMQVYVSNRSSGKVKQWLATYDGNAFTPDVHYDVIILCVGNDDDVYQSLLGKNGFLVHMKSGGVVIDHTTTSADLAQEMYEKLGKHDISFLDAPVSGGEAGACNAVLSSMVGGDLETVEKVKEIMETYCKSITYIGSAGAGQIAKMANQFCIAGILSGLSEAIILMRKSNVDPMRVFQAIKGGAAQSWQMDNRFETMIADQFDFGFAVDHMIKDMTYGIEKSQSLNWMPKFAPQVLEMYKTLSEHGHNANDTSVLVKHYDQD